MPPNENLDRRRFLQAGIGLAGGMALSRLAGAGTTAVPAEGAAPMTQETPHHATGRMPVLFVGHGSPMNAIEDNEWSRGFRTLAGLLPRPKAVLSVSAHWFVSGTFLTGNARPETIHDFGGFPRELFEMTYPAPGDPELAERVVRLLGSQRVSVRTDWGLDHGTWTVLHYLLPEADCPVVQLSINARLPGADHVEIGRALAPLRDEGVLVMGSGNIVHNLSDAFSRTSRGDLSIPDWARGFDADAAHAIEQHDAAFLAGALDTETGRAAHPTPDHYLPLLYTVGASRADDPVRFPVTGFDMGSLSMRAVLYG
jgi:4,5-DOPA dioxygenase extradiol